MENREIEPVLSYVGINQAIILGKNYLKYNFEQHKFTKILTSNMTRTVMTALFSLRTLNLLENITIYPIPYICEIHNNKYLLGSNDNVGLTCQILKVKIEFIKNWMEYNWFKYYDDIELMSDLIEEYSSFKEKNNDINLGILIEDFLNFRQKYPQYSNYETKQLLIPRDITIDKIIDKIANSEHSSEKFKTKYYGINWIKFLRGPTVDFSLLENEEIRLGKDKINEIKKSDIKKFFEFFRLYISPNNNTNNFLIYSHGNFIRSHFNNCYPSIFSNRLINTEIIEETFDKTELSDIENIYQWKRNINKLYVPDLEKLRSEELYNPNICSKHSINTFLGKNRIETSNILENYTEDINKTLQHSNNILVGGKYLHFKKKYLHLKKNK